MSNTLQSVTLQTAVLMQAKEFAKNGQSFSVHDITTAIRSKVNSGELEIPEVEVAGASFRFDIPHVKVKGLFDELWRTGVFDTDFTLNRQFTGVYYEYTPTLVNTAAPVPSFAVSSTPVTSSPSTAATATSTATNDLTTVMSRVEMYLDNCQARGFRPTLKQVQSAIKRSESTGWTCHDLRNLITNDLGYAVVDDPETASAAQVVV